MSETYPNPSPKDNPSQSGEAWQEVGQQFKTLGESLARAVRTAWEDEENRRQVREMQAGLESMVNDVGQAIRDTANSPSGQQIRSDAERTVQNLRTAGEQTVQEVKPHLVSALRDANDALQRMIDRMESKPAQDQQKPPESPGE